MHACTLLAPWARATCCRPPVCKTSVVTETHRCLPAFFRPSVCGHRAFRHESRLSRYPSSSAFAAANLGPGSRTRTPAAKHRFEKFIATSRSYRLVLSSACESPRLSRSSSRTSNLVSMRSPATTAILTCRRPSPLRACPSPPTSFDVATAVIEVVANLGRTKGRSVRRVREGPRSRALKIKPLQAGSLEV